MQFGGLLAVPVGRRCSSAAGWLGAFYFFISTARDLMKFIILFFE